VRTRALVLAAIVEKTAKIAIDGTEQRMFGADRGEENASRPVIGCDGFLLSPVAPLQNSREVDPANANGGMLFSVERHAHIEAFAKIDAARRNVGRFLAHLLLAEHQRVIEKWSCLRARQGARLSNGGTGSATGCRRAQGLSRSSDLCERNCSYYHQRQSGP
jgi:hypothetical protein